MLEYVKVLLYTYPEMEEDAAAMRRALCYRAILSHQRTESPEALAEQLVLLSWRASLYEETSRTLGRILGKLRPMYREALAFRFYGKKGTFDCSLRTVYRRSERALRGVYEALCREGYTEAWFLENFEGDKEMQQLYRRLQEKGFRILHTSPAQA